MVGLEPRVLDALANLARPIRGLVVPAPTGVLDNRRYLGPHTIGMKRFLVAAE
jgi:hypothetical protein